MDIDHEIAVAAELRAELNRKATTDHKTVDDDGMAKAINAVFDRVERQRRIDQNPAEIKTFEC